ncbi:MAG: response regulator [Desulfobacteraceae bacterium]|jgi:PAS domain S-box-containing protein|nr:response regulator [Desulfobacteraceae bacterium]
MNSRILLIDDEPDIVRVLSMSLRADGYEVIPAHSGVEGIEIFEKERPDIVLTDIKMPGMDGIEVLKKVKSIHPQSEVIIITGHGDIDNTIEALQYGASDFINKPVRDEALSIALKRARDKLEIKRQLKEYTLDLEIKIEEATREIARRSNFQIKLIRSSNDGIVATDKKLNIVIFNPGAELIFGYASSEVINKKSAPELFPPELGQILNDALSGKTDMRDFPWQEVAIQSKTGEQIPVRFSGTVLLEKNDQMGTVTFFQDLREIKRLEQELVKSERLAAVGQTVAGLAHGIKNILHGLKGGSYLVDIGINKDDSVKLKKGWEMIKRNVGRTSNLVMDLLSYAKEREPQYEICDPNQIADDVCSLVQDKALENDVAILKEFDNTIGEVSMDPNTLHEVLLNLMSNAVDACLFDENMGKNWQVRLATTRAEGNRIKFEVTDNGAGMDEDVMQKLFTSFFSTKGHRGTGLGLMVTRKLIEEHMGEIKVDSQPGKGTTFSFYLPFIEPSAG